MKIKRTLKRTLKISGITLGTFIGLILLYLGSAYCLSRITVNKNAASQNEVTIYILSNGVHTDLVLPIKTALMDWSKLVKYENTTGKDSTAQFVAFGWGDKGFYLETPSWGELKFSVAFKAAFALSTSAVHATFYKEMKEGEFCKSIHISNSQYQQLVRYVSSSFQKSKSGDLLNIHTTANYGKNDAFYEAVGSYSLFHTCNTWANNGLKACGQKASLWTPFDTGIFYHYQ